MTGCAMQAAVNPECQGELDCKGVLLRAWKSQWLQTHVGAHGAIGQLKLQGISMMF